MARVMGLASLFPWRQRSCIRHSLLCKLTLSSCQPSAALFCDMPRAGTNRHKYQVWSLQLQQPRALSTAKYLSHKVCLLQLFACQRGRSLGPAAA